MKVTSSSAESDDEGTVTLSITVEKSNNNQDDPCGCFPEYETVRYSFGPESAARVAGEMLAASRGER